MKVSARAPVTLLLLMVACGGPSGGHPDGGPAQRDGHSGDAPVDAAVTSDAAVERPAGDARDGAYVGHRDCLPACVAELRAACQRPLPTQGTCATRNGSLEAICYSNGVRENRMVPSDGGLRATFTLPDGRTPCYIVDAPGNGLVLIYRTAAGVEVARTTRTDTGVTVTCAGQTVMLTNQQLTAPDCRDLNVDGCTGGGCQ